VQLELGRTRILSSRHVMQNLVRLLTGTARLPSCMHLRPLLPSPTYDHICYTPCETLAHRSAPSSSVTVSVVLPLVVCAALASSSRPATRPASGRLVMNSATLTYAWSIGATAVGIRVLLG
jgi:hypothetical protein